MRQLMTKKNKPLTVSRRKGRLRYIMAWTPLDDGMLTSTVLRQGPTVVAIWALLLASSDRWGISKLQPTAAASLLRIDDEDAEKAFKVLEAPDPKSRNSAKQGRRIIKTEEGYWEIVSHAKYRAIASKSAAVARQTRYRANQAKEGFRGKE